MRLSFKYQFIFSLSLLILSVGVINYLLFQPGIILFKWIRIGAGPLVIKNNSARLFFTGYFSDITWCISLCLISFALAELKYIKASGKTLLLTLPFITEILQYLGIVKGTFDWYDILTYVVVIALFVLFYPGLKTTVYEKI
ncbi:MAG: hypothetical protein Q8891_15435 [Bacteroidota bacterium]|nr:hypothetical protein [Bacteroidota bacterium]